MSTANVSSESSPKPLVKSEDVLFEKWDRCLSDTAIKMGGGLAMGALFSLLLFRRRAWPMIFGTGSGLGMGYANCQNEFNAPFKK